MAGPIIASAGNPPPGFAVGATVFTGFNDNGPGSADETLSLSVVPAQFGNPTIQQIVGFIGPPAPSDFRLLLSGNVWIR
jgi:hypothetical protein